MTKIKMPSKKVLIFALLVVALAGSGFLFWQNNSNEKNKNTFISQDGQAVNLDPPTEEDKQRVEDNKQRIVDQQEKAQSAPQPSEGNKKQVNPVISYAGQYGSAVEVGAYVNGIFEEGGICTASFTRGAQTLSKSVEAVRNANSVDCPVMAAESSEFNPKGTWQVTVNYNSISSSGSSERKSIEVK